MRPSLCIRNAQTFASMACISLNSFGFIIFPDTHHLTGTDDFAALPLSWPGSVCWTDQKQFLIAVGQTDGAFISYFH